VPAFALGRLVREDEFRRVYREGARRATRLLVLHARPNGLDSVRLGLVVGRRFGRATRRNRLRRQLREAVRSEGRRIASSVDLVVSPRETAAGAAYSDLRAAVAAALGAAGLLDEGP
jgi:ribonuclease P protein component